jgi:hypothetical protein
MPDLKASYQCRTATARRAALKSTAPICEGLAGEQTVIDFLLATQAVMLELRVSRALRRYESLLVLVGRYSTDANSGQNLCSSPT